MKESKKLIISGLFTALTAISAFIKIPLPYIPISLQVFFVMLAGIILGSKWGMISQLAYGILGLVGIPIFSYGGGFWYIIHPTFGYLIGYIIAAYIIGIVIEKTNKHDFRASVLACMLGLLIIYGLGLPYFAFILNLTTNTQDILRYVIWTGFLVTLPGDLIKVALCSLIVQRLPKSIFLNK